MYRKKSKTCQQAIEEPPIPSDAPNHELTKQSPPVISRLKHILPACDRKSNYEVGRHIEVFCVHFLKW